MEFEGVLIIGFFMKIWVGCNCYFGCLYCLIKGYSFVKVVFFIGFVFFGLVGVVFF